MTNKAIYTKKLTDPGRYQGTHSRRVARLGMAIWFGILFVEPDVLQHVSFTHRLSNIGLTLAIIALCDLWFSRRMGLTINEHGLTLHYAFYRKRVPWSKIKGFEWRRWRSPSTETMWITTDHTPVRIPTIGRVRDSYLGSHFDSFIGSSNLRSNAGEEVDAMATLQSALVAAKGADRR